MISFIILTGLFCGCFNNCTNLLPFSNINIVASSKAKPNFTNSSISLYWANSNFNEPANPFITLFWAAEPTLLTEIPGLIAGIIPLLNKSASKNIWPSVIDITFVGI